MRDFIALLRVCQSGAKVTFAGDYYQVRGFRLGVELGVAAADLADCQGGHRPAGMTLHQIPQALLLIARLDFLQADQRGRRPPPRGMIRPSPGSSSTSTRAAGPKSSAAGSACNRA
jgi:hypothetical protein